MCLSQGDDKGMTLQGRPEIAAMFAEPDSGKLVAGFAGISVVINTRSTEMYRILLSASGEAADVIHALMSP
jgi:hypothetical protein